MIYVNKFDKFLNEDEKLDLGGAEPLEIKELDGGVSLVQQSKIGKGKNVIVIPDEFVEDLKDKLEKYVVRKGLNEK